MPQVWSTRFQCVLNSFTHQNPTYIWCIYKGLTGQVRNTHRSLLVPFPFPGTDVPSFPNSSQFTKQWKASLMSIPRTTTATQFNGKPLLTGPGYEYYVPMLELLEKLIQQALQKHCKVFGCQFGLNFRKDSCPPEDNSAIVKLFDSLTGTLEYRGLDPLYFWCREVNPDAPGRHQHYHCLLLLNGSKTQHAQRHLEAAERIWASALGLSPEEAKGLVDYCQHDAQGNPRKNGFMMRRDDPNRDEVVQEFFRVASYLAKTYSKGNAGHRVRSFGSSRV